MNERLELELLILQFAASFTLADHIGDVADDLGTLLKRANVGIGGWSDQHDLYEQLAEMGITTLYGTSLSD